MTLLLIAALWVVASAALTAIWIAYRRYVGRYALEDFETQRRGSRPTAVQRM